MTSSGGPADKGDAGALDTCHYFVPPSEGEGRVSREAKTNRFFPSSRTFPAKPFPSFYTKTLVNNATHLVPRPSRHHTSTSSSGSACHLCGHCTRDRQPVRRAMSKYYNLPDDVLLFHVIQKLGPSDRAVLSRVDRRTRGLVDLTDPPLLSDFFNSLTRFRWARENGCPWDESTCAAAAKGGHLEMLKWAREQDPPCFWDWKTCAAAAEGGQLEVLRWAREQTPPCPWSEATCASASELGHFEVLKWAREQTPPCPWNGGFIDMLKLMLAH